jgi:hypothetical protein
MAGQNPTKINRLETELPEGLLVDAAWLESRGITRQLRSYYTKNNWLEQPTRSVFARPRGHIKWQQVVISLQTILQYSPLLVGGLTALELHGFAHYLSQDFRTIHLYGPKAPPAWANKLGLEQRFVYHNDARLFRNDPIHYGLTSLAWNVRSNSGRDFTRLQGGSVTSMAWGQWDWPLTLSTPERAILEFLDELPTKASFDHADKVMQGLTTLSPRRMEKLLVDCTSIKVKRLFLFLSDRHGHAWAKRLDRGKIDLGSGKRLIFADGRLDPVYQITVPRERNGNE